jgi:branched-subunit amino acid transport protein
MSGAWTAVLLVGVGSYAMRLLPLLLTGRTAISDRAALVLRDAGLSAMSTLLVVSVTSVGARQDGPGIVVMGLALGVAGWLAVTARSVVVVVLGGVATYACAAVVAGLLVTL